MKKSYFLISLLLCFALVVAFSFPAGAYPEGTIEFVVPFDAGGGSDVMARAITEVLTGEGLVDETISVENRSGAGGAIGYSYIVAEHGNDHVIGTISSSWYTGPILGDYPFGYDDFTPVAGLALDSLFLTVPSGSEFTSLDDIVEASREEPGSVNFGVSGTIGDDAVLVYLLESREDIELSIVNFESGGEVLTNLMGEHIDAAWLNPTEAFEQIQAGDIVPLVTSNAERLEGFEEVPTLQDEGIDAVVANYRGILMPGGVSEEAVNYWENVLKDLSESDAWLDGYIEDNRLTPDFVGSEEFIERKQEVVSIYQEIFEEIGEI